MSCPDPTLPGGCWQESRAQKATQPAAGTPKHRSPAWGSGPGPQAQTGVSQGWAVGGSCSEGNLTQSGKSEKASLRR